MHLRDWCAVVVAIYFPPFAVFSKRGFSREFWENLLLSCCCFIPALLHALWVISRYPYEESFETSKDETLRDEIPRDETPRDETSRDETSRDET